MTVSTDPDEIRSFCKQYIKLMKNYKESVSTLKKLKENKENIRRRSMTNFTIGPASMII